MNIWLRYEATLMAKRRGLTASIRHRNERKYTAIIAGDAPKGKSTTVAVYGKPAETTFDREQRERT